MKRRRQEIRRRATTRLAAELGLSVKAMERQAHQMAKATRELGVSAVRFKLERHGMKLTRAEELAIARVHQILTIAMADLRRSAKAIENIDAPSGAIAGAVQSIKAAVKWLERGRPTELCTTCKREPEQMARCLSCDGRGWI